MGILSDFKRLLWVKKSVAKSAAEKVADKVSETWHKGEEKTEDFGEKMIDESKITVRDIKEKGPDVRDKKDDWVPRKPVSETEESGAFKAGEKLGEVAGKVGEVAEKTWDKTKEQGKELLEKAVETSDKVWVKAEEVGEDLLDKAKNLAHKANEKLQEGVDSMLEKAKALDKKIEEEKDKIDPNRDGWADKPLNEKLREHDSTLKDKDDFFERADRYAKGDYSMGKPVITKTEKDDTTGSEEGMTPLPPLPKEDIDDAIIDEGDDKE
jgi:hypothetical protein